MSQQPNILIIGGGLAGLFCALKLAPRPVTVLASAPIGEGASTAWAQGGIAAAVAEGDTAEAHARDTIAAGAGLVDEDVARGMAEEAGERVHDLLSYGVPFDKDLAGTPRGLARGGAFGPPYCPGAGRHGRRRHHGSAGRCRAQDSIDPCDGRTVGGRTDRCTGRDHGREGA